jgi:hypothetical protein
MRVGTTTTKKAPVDGRGSEAGGFLMQYKNTIPTIQVNVEPHGEVFVDKAPSEIQAIRRFAKAVKSLARMNRDTAKAIREFRRLLGSDEGEPDINW